MGKRGGCFVLGTVLAIAGVVLVFVSQSRQLDPPYRLRRNIAAQEESQHYRGLALMYGGGALVVGGGLLVAGPVMPGRSESRPTNEEPTDQKADELA